MAKWFGVIGFAADTVETSPGVWEERITEVPYFGDEIKNSRLLQNSGVGINDNINISVQLSIVADAYAQNHIYAMRYAVYQGAKWKISTVDPTQRPRLILTLGGLYNGE